jgi:copper(I)-binding protein
MKTLPTVAAAIIAMIASTANAAEYKLGMLEIDHPWTRATPRGATVAGGYMTIKNVGSTPDRLIGGSIAVANRFEIHEMKIDRDVAKMRELKGVDIKPGESIEFKPGSSHIMFVNLGQQLQRGATVKGTLTFERAGTIQIEYTVEAIGAQQGGRVDGHTH